MTRLRIVLLTLAAAAALAGTAGLATVFLGLFNTSARDGHWSATAWAMHETFENGVARRAPPAASVPPGLVDPALIELGARHYDSACRMCHGTPGRSADATIAAMEPAPPQISTAVRAWQPQEMHWIVDEGVKMTGMPAWPAEGRGDEVWAVVAFLNAVKAGMDGQEYDRITAPAAEGYCAGCHGATGTPLAPRLNILTPAYIAEALAAYRSGTRPSGFMAHAVTRVPPEAEARLAEALSTLSPPPQLRVAGDPAPGEALARRGSRDIPACLSCHGSRNTNPLIPRLSGQNEAYLAAQLKLWRDGQRDGSDRAVLMWQAARDLSDQDIADLARYFAAQ
ncbi:c-type cytochrome [Paracoccus sp. 11-3]|uniref:C-type cytochrome n=1 Tax=Paracoccus amoyensis TaxID=2760093 RepID=A0A926GFA4_9RHOB|nr:c-type cytochrome [Paracoccus amoyensis]MBC9247516.1 c-type cytochrome [Paracoccus amoyensis]